METEFIIIGIVIVVLFVGPFAYIHLSSSDKNKLIKLFSDDAMRLGVVGKTLLFEKKAVVISHDKSKLYLASSESYHIEESQELSISSDSTISLLVNQKELTNKLDYSMKINSIELLVFNNKDNQSTLFTLFDCSINNPLDGMDFLDKAKKVVKLM